MKQKILFIIVLNHTGLYQSAVMFPNKKLRTGSASFTASDRSYLSNKFFQQQKMINIIWFMIHKITYNFNFMLLFYSYPLIIID